MNELELITDLHIRQKRQGPGGERETALAIEIAGLAGREGLLIADLGCGTGASALELARRLRANVIAVDRSEDFIGVLSERAQAAGVDALIEARTGSIDSLAFSDSSLDAIWSEGAIYNIGFETGVRQWRRFLKPGGILAVSELTWLTETRPEEIHSYWNREYPHIDTASGKISVLESNGYSPLGYFVLPRNCWSENYFRPLEAAFEPFLERHQNSPAARSVVEAERAEIRLSEIYADYVGYGFYIAQKCPDR